MTSSTSSNDSYPPETAKPEDIEAAVTSRKKSVEAAVEFTKDRVAPVIVNLNPREQEELDKILL